MKQTPLKKIKKHSTTYYRKKCVAWAKVQAKERDKWTCQYCGRTKAQGWQMHGSHILPEGSYPLMSAESENIICLCAEHHLAGMSTMMGNSREPSWHGDPTFFARWFEQKYPGLEKKLRAIGDEKKMHLVNWEARWNEIKIHKIGLHGAVGIETQNGRICVECNKPIN